jgi:hypothetical protein
MKNKNTCNSLLILSDKNHKDFNGNHTAPLTTKGARVIEKDLLVKGQIKIGSEIYHYNNSKNFNINFGSESLKNNTTGIENIAIGNKSLYSNTTGIENIAIGNKSLYSNITGISNVAIGKDSLFLNKSNYNITGAEWVVYSSGVKTEFK